MNFRYLSVRWHFVFCAVERCTIYRSENGIDHRWTFFNDLLLDPTLTNRAMISRRKFADRTNQSKFKHFLWSPMAQKSSQTHVEQSFFHCIQWEFLIDEQFEFHWPTDLRKLFGEIQFFTHFALDFFSSVQSKQSARIGIVDFSSDNKITLNIDFFLKKRKEKNLWKRCWLTLTIKSISYSRPRT